MIEIHYPNSHGEIVSRWKHYLKDIVVAHQLISDDNLVLPFLRSSNEKVEGEEAIEQYLEELRKEVDEWRECRCDKYEFD